MKVYELISKLLKTPMASEVQACQVKNRHFKKGEEILGVELGNSENYLDETVFIVHENTCSGKPYRIKRVKRKRSY